MFISLAYINNFLIRVEPFCYFIAMFFISFELVRNLKSVWRIHKDTGIFLQFDHKTSFNLFIKISLNIYVRRIHKESKTNKVFFTLDAFFVGSKPHILKYIPILTG